MMVLDRIVKKGPLEPLSDSEKMSHLCAPLSRGGGLSFF